MNLLKSVVSVHGAEMSGTQQNISIFLDVKLV